MNLCTLCTNIDNDEPRGQNDGIFTMMEEDYIKYNSMSEWPSNVHKQL